MIQPIDVSEFLKDTGINDYHAVVTIQFSDLLDDKVFSWDEIGWRESAYSEDQYQRICKAFEMRFYLDEISILPVGAWKKRLSYELIYNLMPKYRPLYAQVESGEFDPLQTGGEYRKERKINSKFPETLLSENQDYASDGYDFAGEVVGRGNLAEDYSKYLELVSGIDNALLDELQKTCFNCLYTTNVNGW